MTQQEAFDILKMGCNVFLTGPPGSGKTFLLNKYIDYLKKNNRAVAITASTGIAATHMNGTTIHSWSGLGIKDKLSEGDINKLLTRPYLKKRFKTTNVLLIDEISMLHSFQFDLIDKICRAFKNSPEPFGGMQMVCSGDFFQLPPVEKQRKAQFVVQAKVWQEMDIKICYLEEQFRQKKDDGLLALLNCIRSNEPDKARQMLLARNDTNKAFSIKPTKLYTHNIDVDAINNFELAKINQKEYVFEMIWRGNENIVLFLKKNCLVPEQLTLKKGAKVMFVKNNFDKGYVNGTLGQIVDFDDGLPVVQTFENRRIIAEPSSWMIEEDAVVKAEISQIPLRLAWAITVHKSQGMNLDAAQVDLSKSFTFGMGYVALSRLRSFNGLSLLGINDMALAVNQEVLELDRILRQLSKKALESLKRLIVLEISKRQKQFLQSLPLVAIDNKLENKTKSFRKPISTYSQTRLLVKEKLDIKEMADCRELSQETIISHLEKLIDRGEQLDLEYLRLPKEELEQIKLAFAQIGDFKLAPVKEILGDSFSYIKIRLARLFLKKSLEI